MRECSNPSGARQDVKAKLRTTRVARGHGNRKIRRATARLRTAKEIGEDPSPNCQIYYFSPEGCYAVTYLANSGVWRLDPSRPAPVHSGISFCK